MVDFLNDPRALNVPWVDSPFFDAQLEACDASDEYKRIARQLSNDGYAVLEDFLDPESVDAVLSDYPKMFGVELDPSSWDHRPDRRQDSFEEYPSVRQLACHPRILDLLEFLYKRTPIPFQTLNFMVGTEQTVHADSIHFSALPSGFMCGVWVALEDITEDNGPLIYYRGSHKLPEICLEHLGLWPYDHTEELGANYELFEDYVRAIVKTGRFEEQRLLCKKGTGLIWASNLLHGGTPIEKPDTSRMSQVTHYYFSDCAYYKPIHSNRALGELRLKFFQNLHTKKDVDHTINGRKVKVADMGNGNYRMGYGKAFDPQDLPNAPSQMARVFHDHGSIWKDVVDKVIPLIEGQVNAVLSDRKAKPLEKARVVAQLADLALRAASPAANHSSNGPAAEPPPSPGY